MELIINNVSKSFNGNKVIDNFSMSQRAYECVGLIGPNGAGKTTLINLISDVLNVDKGEILFNGIDITKMKKEIGYLPQFPTFFPWMTARETLFFLGQLSGLAKTELKQEVPEILNKVGLKDKENERVGTFSGGMKQRLGIAQALLHKPSLILMDEPVSALDPIGRREVLHLIEKIKKETTILLSTHILGDAEEICDRFVMIKDGRKIEDTTMKELMKRDSKSEIHLETIHKPIAWLKILKKFPFTRDIEERGNKIIIHLDDVTKNKDFILKSALEHHVNLVKFEVYNQTLEDIFLKKVVEV